MEQRTDLNAVLSGAIETPMLRENPEVKSGVGQLKPGDIGQPENVAKAIAILASDDASFVTGAETASTAAGRRRFDSEPDSSERGACLQNFFEAA